MTIKYRYNEGDLLRQITDYVDSTYDEHYSQNKFQATEFIIDGGHGIGFTIGNIMKYAQRYGHKGTPEDWRKDLMKVIHYAIIAMYTHDKETEELDYLEDVNEDTIVFDSQDFVLKTETESFTTMGSATNTLTFFNNDSITDGGVITLPPLKTSLTTKD
jgi:hypothetical protein